MKTATMRTKAARSISANTKDPELIRDRREQLIRAALEVFQEKGFRTTTVRDIGRAAGLTQGTIYNYVRSKEDILFLVCDRVIAQYVPSMEDSRSRDGGHHSFILQKFARGIAARARPDDIWPPIGGRLAGGTEAASEVAFRLGIEPPCGGVCR